MYAYGPIRSERLDLASLGAPSASLSVEVRTGPGPVVTPRSLRERLGEMKELRTGLTTYTDSYHDLRTRYGVLRALTFATSVDGVGKECLGFQSADPTDAAYVSGWACEAPRRALDSARAACWLDSLAPSAGASLTREQQALAAGLARPAACGAGPAGSGARQAEASAAEPRAGAASGESR